MLRKTFVSCEFLITFQTKLFAMLSMLVMFVASHIFLKIKSCTTDKGIKMTMKHEAFVVYGYFIFAYADGLISPPDFRKSNLGLVQSARAIAPSTSLPLAKKKLLLSEFLQRN